MCVLFGTQEVFDIFNEKYVGLVANPTDAQRNTNREVKKKDRSEGFVLYSSNVEVFEKIEEATTSKAVWDTLVRCYSDDGKVKKMRLQALRRQYQLLQMKEDERITDYFTRLQTLTNQMRNCGETLTKQILVEKVLRPLNPNMAS